jgi:DNA polymerase-3 subunit epsilon
MIIAGCDTETTGFSAAKGDRIIEVSLGLWDFDTRAKLRDYTFRINPLRDIPEKATAVHGIRIEDLRDSPTWDKVAPAINAVLKKADLLVCHNVDFDAPFIGEELIRVGQVPPPITTFCTMKNGRWATSNGKNPKLGELCWALKVDYDPAQAHGAGYDVDVMMQCLWAGVDRGLFQLPL